MNAPDLGIYLVTDPGMLRGRRLADVVSGAVAGGVGCVQLRDKDADSRALFDTAAELAPLLRAAGVPFIVNDRLDVALAVGADGVHVGQRDLPAAAVRRVVPPSFIVGVSAENAGDARRAAADGASYVAASPVFATPTKTDTAPALGLAGVRALRGVLPAGVPLVAIGGIHACNAAAVLRAGADSLAVVSDILAADDPRAAAAALRAILDNERKLQ